MISRPDQSIEQVFTNKVIEIILQHITRHYSDPIYSLLSRTCLMLALTCALEFSWIVENPGSSCLLLHPRLVWLVKTLKAIGIQVA